MKIYLNADFIKYIYRCWPLMPDEWNSKDIGNLNKQEAGDIINILFSEMTDAFCKGNQKVHVAPKKLPFFKCGKELKERVDFQAKVGK